MLVMRKRFRTLLLLLNLYAQLYTMCIDLYLNVCDRCLGCLCFAAMWESS
ncbi:hypothetical protein HanPI659440_Chr15g0610051 [Helianthus annuus]|nr:hypothetical protein HanPI659440_Chr15g0610051 [Helianthus annuus]